MSDREPNNGEMIQSELQEEYLKSLDELEEGQLVEGTVIEIGPEQVFVDVGYKSEGKIPTEEFETEPSIGDTVSVVLVSKEGKGGQVVVSKKRADMISFWRTLKEASETQEPVEGTFSKVIKGGFEVDLGCGITAFNPMSQTDVRRVEDPETFVGTKSKFLIERFQKEKRARIVLSRRSWLEREIENKREEFFNTIKEGDEVEGRVKSFTSFGAFIDLGGFDGLLHINDMSWGHASRPKDYVKKDEDLRVKVIKIDPESKKINLSLKHLTPDPWTVFESKYHVDDVVKGKVTKLADFGAFIELEDGIEGLAHVSELSWVRRIKHPKEVLAIGDEVEVKILDYDLEAGRVSLGLKQVLPNPWDSIEEQYPVGKRMTLEVKKLTNAGAFLEIEEGIDGFLHVDDLSWTKKIRHPSAMLKEGEKVEVVVIELDKEARRIRLGVKQLSDDPWQALKSAFPKGSRIEGTVSGITDFGVFVRVQGDIEGLIPRAHCFGPGEEPVEDLGTVFKEGEPVTAAVIEINTNTQRLGLSIRDLKKKQQRKEMAKYIHDEEEESTFTLGDFLKDKGIDS
ncbi:30S ribosomal protein S1 [Marispirochaeta aestuarii]|uniref:30S ribosomal protein S1 n=1 Tax=Marispirochaeta aestuarii TaxID=1963862 RepID=A0A1Y1S0D8_9SPIO|nr:30S ribosomal protein S1 [Marispirochaeta aestuarii]ORC36591.1 30S ribosomal protein S1 [Marispirochaeta aestuarii]